MKKHVKRKGVLVYALLLFISFIPNSCTSVYKQLEDDMVTIPSGSFLMGSEDNGIADPDEFPLHEEQVMSFKLCKFEVNQRLWRIVMGINPSIHRGNSYPVEAISYNDALLFIKKLNAKTGRNYRLPTEIEWEYVATCCGNHENLDDVAWYEKNSNGETHPCGKKRPNAFGIYDMIGNVFEWCAGVYDGCNYAGEKVIQTDERFDECVFRGGAFNSEQKWCRIANRNHAANSLRHNSLGLRLAE